MSPSVSTEVIMLSLTESFAWRILPIVSRFCNDYIPNAMTLLSPLIVLQKVEKIEWNLQHYLAYLNSEVGGESRFGSGAEEILR